MANRSAPPGAIIPTLIYDDLGKAVDWLCGAFGFTERLRVPATGTVGHAQLAVGEGGIMLGARRVGQGFESADSAEFRPPVPGIVSQILAVRVEDVDRHFEHAKHFGAKILNPPTDHSYGERQYTAEDLAGYRWTFTESIADVAPEAWGASVPSPKK